MKYMFRNPGSDTNTGVTKAVPRVAGKFKSNITANVKRSHFNPRELTTTSQAAIMKGLSDEPELMTPKSDTSADSGVRSPPVIDPLFTELDIPQPDSPQQSEGSRRSSADLLFVTGSPAVSPVSTTSAATLGDMSELIIPSVSPTLVPVSQDGLDLTIKPIASAVPQTDVLEQIKDKITESLKETITKNLKEKIKSDDHLVPEDNGTTRRAVSHVIEETVEVVAWIPKQSRKPEATSDDVQGESKVREPNVFIHYSHPLYDIMNTAAQKSGLYGYNPKRVFQKHRPDLPSGKKVKQLPKSLFGIRPTHDQFENVQQLLEGGKAIIPICIGFNGALAGVELEKVLKFYSDNKLAEIVIYIGEYNRIEDPVDQLERIGREKREAWQAENQPILDRYKANTLLREEFVKTDEYKDARKFVTEKLNNKELKFSSVSAGAQKYMDGRDKPSTNTPKLSGQNGDAEIVSQLMLSSNEQDDKDMKQYSTAADAQFKVVVEATVHAAIKDSSDKVRDGARFLAEFRAAIAAENGSVFRHNSIFSKSKQKKKAQNTSNGAQHQPQANSGSRMSPGGSSNHD
jgi:hypothetical protein